MQVPRDGESVSFSWMPAQPEAFSPLISANQPKVQFEKGSANQPKGRQALSVPRKFMQGSFGGSPLRHITQRPPREKHEGLCRNQLIKLFSHRYLHDSS
jgi:hypothetical protein